VLVGRAAPQWNERLPNFRSPLLTIVWSDQKKVQLIFELGVPAGSSAVAGRPPSVLRVPSGLKATDVWRGDNLPPEEEPPVHQVLRFQRTLVQRAYSRRLRPTERCIRADFSPARKRKAVNTLDSLSSSYFRTQCAEPKARYLSVQLI
jgi:hypothetical protein